MKELLEPIPEYDGMDDYCDGCGNSTWSPSGKTHHCCDYRGGDDCGHSTCSCCNG